MNIREFIKQHRKEIDEIIAIHIGEDQYKHRNDDERRMWILNDEALYHWAKSEGVKL